MDYLRIYGAVTALLGFVSITVMHFRLNRLRLVDTFVGWFISLALFTIALFPEFFNALLALFSFERGGGGRLIGLLFFSNIILYVLLFSTFARIQANEKAMSRLVRELAKRNFRDQLIEPIDNPIFVVIPAYNEAENIEFVLNRIPNTVEDLSVGTLVVVDGATDNTEEIVQQLSHKSISHIINRGGGEAIRVGCEMAIEQGAKIIVTIDADGQHQPEEIPRLVKPILDGEADLVNGSRVMGQYESDSSLRALGVVLFNGLFSLLAMKRITDCSNAFRAIKSEEYLKLDLHQPQYYAAEFLLEAIKKGVRVTEVPITIKTRSAGESKKGHSIRYGWGFFKAIITTWLR
jgi:hypothetical protein